MISATVTNTNSTSNSGIITSSDPVKKRKIFSLFRWDVNRPLPPIVIVRKNIGENLSSFVIARDIGGNIFSHVSLWLTHGDLARFRRVCKGVLPSQKELTAYEVAEGGDQLPKMKRTMNDAKYQAVITKKIENTLTKLGLYKKIPKDKLIIDPDFQSTYNAFSEEKKEIYNFWLSIDHQDDFTPITDELFEKILQGELLVRKTLDRYRFSPSTRRMLEMIDVLYRWDFDAEQERIEKFSTYIDRVALSRFLWLSEKKIPTLTHRLLGPTNWHESDKVLESNEGYKSLLLFSNKTLLLKDPSNKILTGFLCSKLSLKFGLNQKTPRSRDINPSLLKESNFVSTSHLMGCCYLIAEGKIEDSVQLAKKIPHESTRRLIVKELEGRGHTEQAARLRKTLGFVGRMTT